MLRAPKHHRGSRGLCAEEGRTASVPVYQTSSKKKDVKKGKTASVHAMKVYEGRRGTASHIVNLGTKWR